MYTSNITIDQIINALADFLQPFAENVEIIRGQVNRVPMPENEFIQLTEILQADIDQPYQDYNNDETVNLKGSKRIDIQIDFYGVNSGNYCNAVNLAFKSYWGFDQFPENIKPLYLSEIRQSPLITGEEQYENRWTVTASIQFNPIVIVPQQSAVEISETVGVPIDLLN